jgi:glutamate synthase domain-containing protein 1
MAPDVKKSWKCAKKETGLMQQTSQEGVRCTSMVLNEVTTRGGRGGAKTMGGGGVTKKKKFVAFMRVVMGSKTA